MYNKTKNYINYQKHYENLMQITGKPEKQVKKTKKLSKKIVKI